VVKTSEGAFAGQSGAGCKHPVQAGGSRDVGDVLASGVVVIDQTVVVDLQRRLHSRNGQIENTQLGDVRAAGPATDLEGIDIAAREEVPEELAPVGPHARTRIPGAGAVAAVVPATPMCGIRAEQEPAPDRALMPPVAVEPPAGQRTSQGFSTGSNPVGTAPLNPPRILGGSGVSRH
jgi:hypothetical protein